MSLCRSKKQLLSTRLLSRNRRTEKITMTGAATTVDVNTLRTSTSGITNALAGNVAGIMARQTSGQPGNNISEFWIRGISTLVQVRVH